ncbi:zinc ribbon domain-containing protein [Haliangium ochraceum]|uniref:DUF7577 domain-containing protein n=1 Tax=Haliangium ochraceum (strain DSM 14365 / JCM 11303 / SMP-2) TaxID=502025 RepID=D0LYQ0_HALO1|nr:zinc ribbon domain-containing protein [Haliangium ochraceum]ACY17916.1 hypothetical protein Hoch_5433 [Haliangium ochraceum DSM 14365]
MSDTLACPQCGAANPHDARFCESCGHALAGSEAAAIAPGAASEDMPDAQMMLEKLHKAKQYASRPLLLVAALHTISTALILFRSRYLLESLGAEATSIYLTMGGVAAAFWILYLWSRHSPFPAAIVGTVLYLAVHLPQLLADPSSVSKGILFKVLILFYLARAIVAALKYRDLRATLAADH